MTDNKAEGSGTEDEADRLQLAQQLKIASHAVELAGFSAAGLLDKGSVTSLFLMAHALEQMSDRAIGGLGRGPQHLA
ncbi:hypothetical protein [Tropicibacter alexandrii]|uniref:hypothetical protein n=1 Tax=Tropicibacter alexandrii TaxID=2267683 RepID=UPI000EF4C9A9|nr:hypothetical protein [Tropicibacter alexandrii]